MTSNTYTEIDSRLGAHIVWNNAHVIYQERTHRGTLVEFVERPQWGVACFMNGTIQSCESDEYIYHRNVVDLCFRSGMPDDCRVAVFGGGEGATAREVLKYDCVENVDMFEWDRDIVRVFQTIFPSWADGAWNDSRLHVYFEDIFSYIAQIGDNTYDKIIIDLFEPDEQTVETWTLFLQHVRRILKPDGIISMYAGMYNHSSHKSDQGILTECLQSVGFSRIWQGRVYIPSFLGEACFLYAGL
jgi:spermidine synthase